MRYLALLGVLAIFKYSGFDTLLKMAFFRATLYGAAGRLDEASLVVMRSLVYRPEIDGLRALAVLAVLAGGAAAQETNVSERTFLTFSSAVEMPGVTLQPGTYVFKLADSASRNVSIASPSSWPSWSRSRHP